MRRGRSRTSRWVWTILRPYRFEALLGAVLVVAWTVVLLAGPAIVRYGIDDGLGERDAAALDRAAIGLVGAAIGAYVLYRAFTIVLTNVAEGFLYDLRVRVFDHLQTLSMGFYDRERSGVLVSRMTSDVDALSKLAQEGLFPLVHAILMLVLSLVVLLVLSPVLALVCVAALVPVALAGRTFRVQSRRAYRGVQDEMGQTLTSVQEGLAGVRVIQAFAAGDTIVDRFREHNRRLFAANMRAARIAAWYFPVVEASGLAATGAVVVAGGLLVAHGSLTLGTVAAFVLYVENLFAPVQELSYVMQSAQAGAAGFANLVEILDTRPDLREHPRPVDLPRRGAIRVEGVSFSYDERGSRVLTSVDLEVADGERLALVGPTGAGKSSLAKLMARLYDPTEGRVTFAGVDLREASPQSLRERIAVVSQEGFLFGGTIRDNVRLGRADAEDDEIEAALRAVSAYERFASLPDGLDTAVNARGSRLSAGERQLVALARVALARPAVLILDEATSNVDPATERLVGEAMAGLVAGRTVIAIAHRLTTAQTADRVAVVDGGAIVELGTHADLLAAGGRYASLYRSWLGG